VPDLRFSALTVPQKPSPLANESVVSTLIEMVSLNLFKPANTMIAEPSEDEEQALDPAYSHTQVLLAPNVRPFATLFAPPKADRIPGSRFNPTK